MRKPRFLAQHTKARAGRSSPLSLVRQSNISIDGFSEFEIDILGVFRNSLLEFFAEMRKAPLTRKQIDKIPSQARGAYILFYNGEPVYAGKTDAAEGFAQRLGRHSDFVQDRVGLEPAKIEYKAVAVLVFSMIAIEDVLIKRFKEENPDSLAWNLSGFGNNDPGRHRDRGQPGRFDTQFPIDVDRPVRVPVGVSLSVAEVIKLLNEQVAFKIRAQNSSTLNENRLTFTNRTRKTVQAVLEKIALALSSEWQITCLPGRIINYKEKRPYAHSRLTLRGKALPRKRKPSRRNARDGVG